MDASNAPVSPYNAAIGELIKLLQKNIKPETKLP